MKIFTHLNLDLDAICSVWAGREFIPGAQNAVVEFRSANWDGVGMNESDIALDIHAGGRGVKGEQERNGIVHSCFASVVARYACVKDQQILANLVRFVDAQDVSGSVIRALLPEAIDEVKKILAVTNLNYTMRALQAQYPGNDTLVLERMSEILSGMLTMGRTYQRAMAESLKAEILDGGKVAIVRSMPELAFAVNGILFQERGVRIIVYVDGCNLGVIRHGEESLRTDHDELQQVVKAAGEGNEWFAHSAGFLYCRGSRKAPAQSLSRVNPRALAEVAAKLLG